MAEQNTLGDEMGLGHNAQKRLLTIVERCERVLEEIAGGRDDLNEILSEAKGEGFNVQIIRKAIRLRAMDQAKRQEQEALLDTYMIALKEAKG